jgi:hypothetical protein
VLVSEQFGHGWVVEVADPPDADGLPVEADPSGADDEPDPVARAPVPVDIGTEVEGEGSPESGVEDGTIGAPHVSQ